MSVKRYVKCSAFAYSRDSEIRNFFFDLGFPLGLGDFVHGATARFAVLTLTRESANKLYHMRRAVKFKGQEIYVRKFVAGLPKLPKT